MENDYYKLPIEDSSTIEHSQLILDKSKELAKAVLQSNSSSLIECLKVNKGDNILFSAGDEIVIYDTQIETGQRPVTDIRYTERIAIHFTAADNVTPYVYALRSSFPNVLHRISLFFEKPACLCIYELPYDELKLDWRPQKFLFDIRTWLSLTAAGKLHQDDQPLEPLMLFNHGTIIIPHDVQPNDTLGLFSVSEKKGKHNLIATRDNYSTTQTHILIIKGKPQNQGIINRTPRNITELSIFLEKAEINLLVLLKEKLKVGMEDNAFIQSNLLLLIQLPKTNTINSVLENDFYAFLSVDNIEKIGISLNIWAKEPSGKLGSILFDNSIDPDQVTALQVYMLIPYIKLSKKAGLLLSGEKETENDKDTIIITQIGVGALGSQLFKNLSKIGYGKWNLIDSDILLPHNCVRHELSPKYLGWPKSFALAQEANTIFDRNNFVKGLWEDYIYPENKEELEEAILKCEIILDTSASVAVARNLANRLDFKGRKISMFLNPAGTDLVMIAEDTHSTNKLDYLEFQYYRALQNKENLSGHLINNGSPVRYSNSCRDITNRISQDNISILASIGSAIFKKAIKNEASQIKIWRINGDTQSVSYIDVPTQKNFIIKKNGWEIIIDTYVIDIFDKVRNEKLPAETGGILIGGYDFISKKIYIVDTILSPPDSEETPGSYIRGIVGVKEELSRIENETAGHLKYIGEWHSHPKDYPLDMSDDDEILFSEIKKEMDAIGYPPLMIIVGDKKFETYL